MSVPTPLLDKWRYFLQDYESPDSFIEWSYYGLISAALQRRVWLDEEPRQCFPNDFVLLVGPPASGKTMVIVVVRDMLSNGALVCVDENGQLLQKINVAPDSITLEAMTSALCRKWQRKFKYSNEKGEEKLYVHCSLQFLAEELGVLLRKHTEDMVNMLIQGYDARQIERETKGAGIDNVRNVCIGMLGGTTPEFMRLAMNSELMGIGFISRFVTIYESGPRFLREHPGFSRDQRLAWLDIFQHVSKKVTQVYGQCSFSPEAAAWRKDFYESGGLISTRKNTDPTLDTYFSRKNLHWKKLSIVQHFSEDFDSREISLATVKRSLATLGMVEPNMHLAYTAVGKNAFNGAVAQIQRIIEINSLRGNGVSQQLLYNAVRKDLTVSEFNQCMESLVISGIVVRHGDNYRSVRKTGNPQNQLQPKVSM